MVMIGGGMEEGAEQVFLSLYPGYTMKPLENGEQLGTKNFVFTKE